MKKFVFITREGFTFQPNSEGAEPDIENCQVIGFSDGATSKEAFSTLIKDNRYLLNTTFNELVCYELKGNKKDYFDLSDYTNN